MGILIKNGKILDNGELVQRDILIIDNVISKIAEQIEDQGYKEIDVKGKLVSAGFIDMHVHLREPGFEAKETIATGTAAAARGGYTAVACMPNTKPVTDRVEVVKYIKDKAAKEGVVRVLPIGSITLRELGDELTDMAAMKEAGIVGVSDDGVGVQSSRMMKEGMKRAAELGLPVIAHCEDDTLAKGGSVHEGIFAEKNGLKGIPNEAESIHVARDIMLAEATGVHYHVCHISAEQSVRHVRYAKQLGLKVTSEVCPHHLLLTDEDIPSLDSNYKMNPPLRSKKDREALIQGLKDGTIDIIVTDHAPHTEEEKKKGMALAPFGIVGLETAFPLLYTHLVLGGEFTLEEIIEKMTRKPAELFGLPWGRLEEGAEADLTIIDLETEREVNPQEFASKGKNTPFTGWKLKGWPVMTVVAGSVVWKRDEVLKTV
ncbi:dihydroorotase [Ammoniphilus sp. CFH 90114]|uniref:dihydroorotase n=1 Tax=Ammoniphilus sp. CFH 90114 TaxID=2493665 RepID=UPI00100F8A4C|nr:dihydroorotase [Ammoniphilus sp. CFH 90114]RXT15029.1 dihydroorotase [Ammoniphilus sp. CFH 90114]